MHLKDRTLAISRNDDTMLLLSAAQNYFTSPEITEKYFVLHAF